MPVPAHLLPETEFTLLHLATDVHAAPILVKVRASYFTEDGKYTLFKDAKHQAVFGIPTERVFYVQRGVE